MEAALTDDAADETPEMNVVEDALYMEHRFGRRMRCGSPVRLSAGGGMTGQGRLVNVSLSGAYLETALPLPLFGTVLVASGDSATGGAELRASVVRRDRGGVGVEWCETPSRSICEIFGCGKNCEVA